MDYFRDLTDSIERMYQAADEATNAEDKARFERLAVEAEERLYEAEASVEDIDAEVPERKGKLHSNFTSVSYELMSAVEDALTKQHDAASAIEAARNVRHLQSEQNSHVTEILGLIASEVGTPDREHWSYHP